MATKDTFYRGAEVRCATVQGLKHTVDVYFRFRDEHSEGQGQGYFLKDETGEETLANRNQLWERFRDALRTAKSEAECT